MNECQSKHYIFSTVVVVMFTDSATSFIRNFMRLSLYFGLTKKIRRFLIIQVGKVSKLFKNKNIHLEKFWPHYDMYWQYHFTEENWLKHFDPRRSLKSHSKWQECLSKTLQNIPFIKCRSCETNSVVKYQNYLSHGSKIL